MKFSLYLFALFILCSGFRCTDVGADTILTDHKSNTYTMVFMDKTASTIQYDPIQKDKHVIQLNKVVTNLKEPGDYIKLFYIDSNTRDGQDQLSGNKIDFDVKVEENKGDRTRSQNEDEYLSKVSKLQQNLRDQLRHHFNAQNNKAREQNTDLWDILYLINEEAKNTTDMDRIEVLIFSDMVESIKGNNRRDFHAKPIKDTQEAIKFANDDFTTIQKHLAIKQIRNAGIIKIKLFFPNSTPGRANIQEYWNTIFSKFGMQVISTT
jgi:hypothetical protein